MHLHPPLPHEAGAAEPGAAAAARRRGRNAIAGSTKSGSRPPPLAELPRVAGQRGASGRGSRAHTMHSYATPASPSILAGLPPAVPREGRPLWQGAVGPEGLQRPDPLLRLIAGRTLLSSRLLLKPGVLCAEAPPPRALSRARRPLGRLRAPLQLLRCLPGGGGEHTWSCIMGGPAPRVLVRTTTAGVNWARNSTGLQSAARCRASTGHLGTGTASCRPGEDAPRKAGRKAGHKQSRGGAGPLRRGAGRYPLNLRSLRSLALDCAVDPPHKRERRPPARGVGKAALSARQVPAMLCNMALQVLHVPACCWPTASGRKRWAVLLHAALLHAALTSPRIRA